MTEVKKRRPGRPRLNIDPAKVERLASISCSYEEMAAILGCSTTTLSDRFRQAIEKGRSAMKASLRRRQFEVAMGRPASYDETGTLIESERAPNVTMLIWLGKCVLGQSERQQVELMNLDDLTDEQLATIAAGRLPRA